MGGSIVLITGNTQTKIAELADEIIVIPASSKDSKQEERSSIQPMGSLFEQTSQIVCDVMVLQLMEQYEISVEVQSIRSSTSLEFDVHMMVQEPIRFAQRMIKALFSGNMVDNIRAIKKIITHS